MNRRNFLHQLGLATSGTFLAFSGFERRAQALAENGNIAKLRAYGFGELVPTDERKTRAKLLCRCPKGFEYKVFGRVENQMSDGRVTPAAHDGMETFEVKNGLRIIRNHEVGGRSCAA